MSTVKSDLSTQIQNSEGKLVEKIRKLQRSSTDFKDEIDRIKSDLKKVFVSSKK